jgi:hypothetical protein
MSGHLAIAAPGRGEWHLAPVSEEPADGVHQRHEDDHPDDGSQHEPGLRRPIAGEVFRAFLLRGIILLSHNGCLLGGQPGRGCEGHDLDGTARVTAAA